MKKSLTVILAVLLALFVFVSCEQSVGDLIGFNLVFKANGGTGTMETVFIKGSSIPAPANEFERSGYTFSSWNTMADGSGTEYEVGDTINGHDVQSVTLFAQWTAVPYNITIAYAAHGSVNAQYNSTYTVSNGEIYIPLVATPDPGYKLSGYEVTGASIFDNEYLMIAAGKTGDITVTPVFEKVFYTITVNDTELGSGSAEVTGYTISNYTNVVTLSAAPYLAYSDYVMLFDWQLSAPAGVTIANGTISIPADTIGDISVTPVFTPKTGDIYLVTLHTAGGTIAEGQDVAFYKHGDGTTVLPTSVTRTESSFQGWYDNSGYTGEAVDSFSNDNTGDKEFWAKWNTNSYTVTLNKNGGTINSGNVTSYTYGTGATLPTDVTKTGYTFGGWYDNSELSGNPVTTISSTDTGNKSFYAKWTVNNYTVAFNKNAESATGTMTNEAFNYGEEKALTSNAFARTGYTFSGWNTVATPTQLEPGAAYSDGQVVSNLTSIDDETVNLYAQWTANEYTVTFDGNGGSTPSSKTVTYDSTYGSLIDSSWTGHTFLGWFTAAEGGTEVTSTTSVTILEAQTLYAHWSLNNYTVAFNKYAESATGTMADEAFNYGEEKALTSNAFARTGYTFSGWNTVATPTELEPGTAYTNGQVVSNLTSIDEGTVDLYAQWTANEYTVTFDGNGGSTPSSKTVTYGSTYGYLTDSSWTGRTFLGWFTAAQGGTKVTSTTSVTILDNQTLYAHWSLNNYFVAFNKNAESATGTMADEAFDYGEEKALTSNAFTRTGYTFSGWNTVATPTQLEPGTAYSDGQEVSNLTSTDEGTVDLYAQWELDVYSVTITSGTEGYTVEPSASSYSISDPDQDIILTIDPAASVSSYSYEGPTTATIVTDWPNNKITIKSGSYGGDIKITCYF